MKNQERKNSLKKAMARYNRFKSLGKLEKGKNRFNSPILGVNKEINNNKENKKEIKIDLNKEKKKMMSEVGCDADITIKKEKPKIKVDNSCNFSVNNSLILSPDEIICCWSCLKPLKKDDSIKKEYDISISGDDDPNLFKYKYFCSEKCRTIFEKEKKEKQINETKIKNELINNIKNKSENKNESEININRNNNKDDSLEEDNYDPMEDF